MTMLDKLLAITGSYEFEEAGGFLWLNSVQWERNAIILQVALQDNERQNHRWQITCEEVRAHRFIAGAAELQLSYDHPLLWAHTQPQVSLYFRGKPKDLLSLMGGLERSHRELAKGWFPLERFTDSSLRLERGLEIGYGLFGTGPEILVTAYEKILKQHGLTTSTPTPSPPKYWDGTAWAAETPPLAVLILGESYVVAKEFKAQDQGPFRQPYRSVREATFLQSVQSWIEASGEVLAMIRYHGRGGAKDFEFHNSVGSFKARLQRLPPRTSIIVFRDRQLPLRGRVDEEFIRRAVEMMREGQEFLISELEKTTIGAASWFNSTVVETSDELLERLRDTQCCGKQVAFGPYPPWLEDNDAVISAIVPNEDGSVTTGAY
jgi:hypothetical protein